MRSWLTYIFLLMVACGTVLTSCSDVLSEEGLGTCDDRTTVRLTISFGGNNGTMSRDVDSKDEGLDYTTSGQAEINAEDIYALVVDASGNFLYRIKDLKITANPAEGDTYYTRTLTGTMIQTKEKVRIVLLANLIQNNIIVNNGTELDSKEAVEAYIDGIDAETAVSTIYNNLVYNYDGTTTPWTLTGDNARRIPMWGITAATQVPSTGTSLDCYLYRAVAKVQIWVNMKKGIAGTTDPNSTNDDFKITKITVQKANSKGYCVSLNTPNESETVQYTAPSVPNEPGTQTVTYGSDEHPLNVTQTYSDEIYIPERFNTDNDAVTIDVHYTFNGEAHTGTIEFKDSDTGQAFDVVRNHSYIFNITSVGAELGLTCVVQEWEKETEVWDFTENISESEFLNWGNQGLDINDAGEVIIPNTNNYTCTFGLLTPTDGTWQASLIPVGGVTDAFEFVGEHTGTISASGTGTVTLTIKAKYTYVFNENNAAKLRIVVRTKDGRTLVANLTGKEGFAEYTLVQNVNKRN